MVGGRASRLGRDKALVSVNGRTLLERAVAAVRPLAAEVLLVGPMREGLNLRDVRWVQDEKAGLGPIGGLLTALNAARFDWVLCLGCDTPFITTEILRTLIVNTGDLDASVLRCATKPEPLVAAYQRSTRDTVRRQIENGDLVMHSLLRALRVTFVDIAPQESIRLINVNTFDDLAKAEQIAPLLER